ncbi:VanZ family protein [Pontimicrobium sp. MEBiC01747]
MLKKLILPVSIAYTITLAVLSLIKVNKVTSELPTNSDKIFHALAYAIFTALWFLSFYYKIKLKKTKALVFSFSFSSVFGIIIELLQGSITKNREADLFDVIANTTGTLIAMIIITIVLRGVKK